MKKILIAAGLFLISGSAFAASIAVTVSNGSRQPGTAAGINISSGTIDVINTTTITVQNINSTFVGFGRNRFKNGEMLFDQRYEGSTVTVVNNGGSGAYFLDNVKFFSGQTQGLFTVHRSSETPVPPGFRWYCRYKTSSSTAVIAATHFYTAEFVTEGPDTRDFLFGTEQAKQVNISFWVRSSSAGYYGGNIGAQNGNRAWPIVYRITTPNTWQYITQTLPGDTTGFWDIRENDLGLFLGIDFGSGTNFNTSTGAWLSGDLFRTTNTNNIISVQNATWDITGVQLELGDHATAYEFVPYETQLSRLQRYYSKSYSAGVTTGTSTSVGLVSATASLLGATTSETGLIRFPVPMALNGVFTPINVTLYSSTGTVGQWVWFSTGAVATSRATTVNLKGQYGFDIFQTGGTELWTDGHWTAESFLGN
jgi:hypothetical protein